MASDKDISLTAATVADGMQPSAPGEGLRDGSRLGPYVIRRLLGEGGMGRVYLAEQRTPVHREVALKLINEQMTHPLTRAYFEIERQALAQMQHPAIAQVFDAGTTEDGHPYLAMEWVEGVPITMFCAEQKLDIGERLALFERVCHGVQHAHQKGVIHRDLKPDNVLVRRVDGVPQPKIIDFGVAIGESQAGAGSASVSRAGTAAYMSPEQASAQHLDIDIRSDVYSLGVMLFEVLTDVGAATLSTSAHRSDGAVHQTLLAVDGIGERKAQLHADLLAAAQALPAELRAIVRKALAPDRHDRYPSAAALADDLQRYAKRQPLHALPITRSYVARKFVSRHRLGLTAASLVGLALVAGMVLAVTGLRRAEASARIAKAQEAIAHQQQAKAEAVADFLQHMLAGVSPAVAQGMDTKLMRSLLDSAAHDAASALAGQPEVRASIQDTIGQTYRRIGEYRAALQQAEAAVASAAQAGVPTSQLAVLLASVGNVFNISGNADVALIVCNAAWAMVRGLPMTDPDRLDVEKPLAFAEAAVGDLPRAKQRFEDVLATLKKMGKDGSSAASDALRGLANVNSNLGDLAKAEALDKRLIAVLVKRDGADSPDALFASNDLAVVYARQEQFAKAERLLRKLLPRMRRVLGADHPATLAAFSNLGGAIRQQGRNEEARPYYEKTLAVDMKRYGADDYRTVAAQSNMAELLRDAGQLSQAERHARAAVAHAQAAFGRHAGYRGYFHDVLGTILARQKRYRDAQNQYQQGWQIYLASSSFGADHLLAQKLVGHVVALYTKWNKPKLAAQWRARLLPSAHAKALAAHAASVVTPTVAAVSADG